LNKKEYKEKTGYDPKQDDLERVNCNLAGNIGHYYCGWCLDHNAPRFECGCFISRKSSYDPQIPAIKTFLNDAHTRSEKT